MDVKGRVGGWDYLAWLTEIRVRQLRRVMTGETKTVTMGTMDKVVTRTGYGDLDDWVWFTAEDLEVLGIWKPHLVCEGTTRVAGREGWVMSRADLKANAKRRKKEKKALERRKKKRAEIEWAKEFFWVDEEGNRIP